MGIFGGGVAGGAVGLRVSQINMAWSKDYSWNPKNRMGCQALCDESNYPEPVLPVVDSVVMGERLMRNSARGH